MPEYLAPGVFVEEVSFRAKSIEGVATSTTGFAGMTRHGPVRYAGGPGHVEPRLITSFGEYERVFGGLESLSVPAGTDRVNYMAHAARVFFLNGGGRLYVSRVFTPNSDDDTGVASVTIKTNQVAITHAPATKTPPADEVLASPQIDPAGAVWRARWPGAFGNVLVRVRPTRSRNIAAKDANGKMQARGARDGALVEIDGKGADGAPLEVARLLVVTIDADGVQTFTSAFGTAVVPAATATLKLVELTVTVSVSPDRTDVYGGLSTHPQHKRSIARILQLDDPEDEDAVVWLDWAPSTTTPVPHAIAAAVALAQASGDQRLAGGNDGKIMTATTLTGQATSADDPKPTGLTALADVEDIAIVSAPDAGDLNNEELQASQALVDHAELCRYRIAIIDGPKHSTLTKIREFRGQFDSTRAAIYHPWVLALDPLQPATQGAPPPLIGLPPSGFVAGIYARSDIQRGVWKAPANEIVRGVTRFEANINTGRQQVLNPEGINALRFFEGRGNRVWGARTVTSDPEWKYVNVRRLFIYLEHSIDKSTQWAVFEPNGDRLWANIRQTIEDFLLGEWKNGALLGTKPEEAYFVRCDRTTMTQNDLDNGRLICLIGVAPVRPAEFVIFRIGQWTAESKLI